MMRHNIEEVAKALAPSGTGGTGGTSGTGG
jgi:hypothetical protein